MATPTPLTGPEYSILRYMLDHFSSEKAKAENIALDKLDPLKDGTLRSEKSLTHTFHSRASLKKAMGWTRHRLVGIVPLQQGPDSTDISPDNHSALSKITGHHGHVHGPSHRPHVIPSHSPMMVPA